jgi:hypothetical protein
MTFSKSIFCTLIDGAEAIIDPENYQIHIRSDRALSKETLDHIVDDLLIPKLLSRTGFLVLHGGLVAGPAGGIAFIGPSGHGKSTLSASLSQKDYALISDDAMILQPEGPGYRAERLYPSLRLFPDSLDRLFPDISETGAVADYTDKRRVPFASGPESAPLRALFRLASPGKEIDVRRLSPAAACMGVLENAFALDPEDAQETGRRLERAAQVARVVPVFDLAYPRDYDFLPTVHAAILDTISAVLVTP